MFMRSQNPLLLRQSLPAGGNTWGTFLSSLECRNLAEAYLSEFRWSSFHS